MEPFFSPSSLLCAPYVDTGERGGFLILLGPHVGLSLATFSISHQRTSGSHSPSTRRNTVCLPSPRVVFFFFAEAQLAGHITSYRYLGKDLVILSSVDAIKDLLEKRGSVYSDRADMPFLDMWVSNRALWWSCSG